MLLLAALIHAMSAAPAAGAGFSVRLRNDLTPGSLTTYRIAVEGVRTSPGGPWNEQLTFRQGGRLTLAILEATDRKHARRAWMVELDEPVVVSLTRDGQPVQEEVSATEAGLPPKAVQLRLSTIDSSQADATAVGGSLVQRAGMLLALDFTRWPNRLIAPEESWETPAEREELDGVWTHRYVAGEGRGRERLATGSFSFSGQLAGTYADVATIRRAEGTWRWRVAKRGLESSSAQIVLAYGPEERPLELAMRVTLQIEQRERMPKERLTAARIALTELDALAAGLRDPSTGAEEKLQQFIETKPDCLWLPVARNLLERSAFEQQTFGSMAPDALRDALVHLIERWQRAALATKLDALQPIRATFRVLVETNRATLYELTGDQDPNTRAMAVFCVAFGTAKQDLAQLTASTRDAEARVRAWAAYGLAERRDEDTDPAILLALLADGDPKVRQRACMAVRTCVSRTAPHRDRFIEELVHMVRNDASHPVHIWAAQAIDTLATKADLPALIDAEATQDVPRARQLLEATIRSLGGVPRDPLDD